MASRTKTQSARTASVYQTLPVNDLTAGLDLRTAQTLMAPERARSLVNWSLEQPGALVVRPGYRAFSTTSLGAGRIQGGARVYLNTALPSVNSTAFTLIAWQGGVYGLTDSGGWANGASPVYSTISTGAEVHFPHDRDLVAVFDGVNAPRKSTNGTTWTRFGIASGTVASTVSSTTGSSGAFSSATEYEFTYGYKDRDLAHYSNESSVVSTFTPGSTGPLGVQIPNSTDAQVDAVVVYARNKTAGEAIRRKISSAAMSAGTSSTIVLTSTSWTSNDEAPSDHDVAGVYSFGVVWKNRWWARSATVKNRIHFTQLFQPQAWPALFYLDIPFDRGDEIRALLPIGDSLIIFGTTKIFIIVGQTSLDFEVRPALDSQGGAFGPRAVCAIENGIVHLDAAGILIFDGATDRLLSQDLDPAIRDLVTNGDIASLQRMPVAYDVLRKELRNAVPRRYPSGTWGEYVLDLARTNQQRQVSAWTETDRTIGGYLVWNGPEAVAGNRGRIFSWHSSIARVFEESVGTTANSSDLTASYEGPGLVLGMRTGRWVDLHGEYEPHAGTFSVEAVIDGVPQGPRTISIGSGQATYDTSMYDTDVYAGAGRRIFYTNLPLGAEGRVYVQQATYTGQEAFKWFGYAPGLVPEVTSRDFSE
jgi:hypothetical protein